MSIFKKLLGGNILYYPGCLTKFVAKDLEENYKKILTRIGIDFIQLKDLEFCCGSPVLNSGHKEEALLLAQKNFKVFRDHRISKIITSCPACFKTFSKDYPELLKEWDIEVEHITQTLANAIKQGKLKPNKLNITLTYHDPCHLGRHCGIYEEPREILKSIGAKIEEMRLNKEFSFCCGGGSGVKSNYPELSNAIAKERIDMAKETGAECLVTTCPMCFMHLKENSKDLKIKELSEVLEGSI
jgi:Fe-S oxidoreductase